MIARVFPRRTNATPDDELVFIGEPPQLIDIPAIADEIHVSVTFTYDIQQAERLARYWECFGLPVKIGGPAYKQPAGEFVPGLYLGKGNTITSRGCPNKCWFCSVPKVYKGLTELEIKDGWIIQDDNLLACSENHIKAVFEMLKRQPEKPIFTGGLEAKILKEWHVGLIADAKTARMYFAYDTPDDYEPLVEAGKLLSRYNLGLNTRKACAYVLCGYPKDTFELAEERLIEVLQAGLFPYAMLYKDEQGNENRAWRQFQRQWVNPWIIVSNNKEYFKGGD